MVVTQKQKSFIIKAYAILRNGNTGLVDLRPRFPNVMFLEANFFNSVRNTVRVFGKTESVGHKKVKD